MSADNNHDRKWFEAVLVVLVIAVTGVVFIVIAPNITPPTQLMTINGEAVEYIPFTPGSTAIGILNVPEQLEGKEVIVRIDVGIDLIDYIDQGGILHWSWEHVYIYEIHYIDRVFDYRGTTHYQELYPDGTVHFDNTEDQIFGVVVRRG